MPIRKYINILVLMLVFAMFLERFSFAVVVYKTKNYGMVLILLVIIFNSIFLYFIQKLKKNKHKKRLHEVYNIDRTPRVGCCVIAFVA